jgi:hypothetical protein
MAPLQATRPVASHGLRGEYFGIQGIVHDAYGIPTANESPASTRVDERIAFGRGQGFLWETHWKQRGPGGSMWWMPDASAVIWKGYIRFPRAGTYFVVTASSGASAVYINGARIALNGGFGGSIPSAEFVYDDPAVPQAYKAVAGQYAMPVVISAARVLPIEVRYALHDSSSKPRGIDLYWVTPDAERDSKSLPIATVVPTDALYVAPPEAVLESVVSASHTTMSSDVLYLPNDGIEVATVTIRVADKQGNPVPGRRVHVAALQSSEHGSSQITQPKAVTDPQGITTAQFRITGGTVSWQLFATVVDEPVDVGQVVEIIGHSATLAFLPLTYSPYYGARFKVTPQPMRVGQPVHLDVPLKNYRKQPYEVQVIAHANEQNIGLSSRWTEVGRSETYVLQPGESRDVTITWTPTEEVGHVCFTIEVWGKEAPVRARAEPTFQIVRIALTQKPNSGPLATGEPTKMDSRTHNIGAVLKDILQAAWKKADDSFDGVDVGLVKVNPRTGRVSAGRDILVITLGGQTVLKIGAKGEFGATSGSDSRKEFFDAKGTLTLEGPMGFGGNIEGRTGVRISDKTQEDYSGPLGHVGSKSGAVLKPLPATCSSAVSECL